MEVLPDVRFSFFYELVQVFVLCPFKMVYLLDQVFMQSRQIKQGSVQG